MPSPEPPGWAMSGANSGALSRITRTTLFMMPPVSLQTSVVAIGITRSSAQLGYNGLTTVSFDHSVSGGIPWTQVLVAGQVQLRTRCSMRKAITFGILLAFFSVVAMAQ